MSRRPRVLLADDDATVRAAVSRLLSASCDVIGYAPDCTTLFEAAVQLRPDVVLLDFSLPGKLHGLEVCRRVKTLAPEASIVVFTGNDDAELKRLAYEAGASGFVWKLQAEDLLHTIHEVVGRI